MGYFKTDKPEDRNLGMEANSTFKTMAKLAPQQLAAAQALQDQASQLATLVSVFKLDSRPLSTVQKEHRTIDITPQQGQLHPAISA